MVDPPEGNCRNCDQPAEKHEYLTMIYEDAVRHYHVCDLSRFFPLDGGEEYDPYTQEELDEAARDEAADRKREDY
jgi:hypothetical protein